MTLLLRGSAVMGRVGVKDKKKTAHFNKKSQRIDTKVQLKELKATPTGRALVNQLVKSKNVFRIVEGKGSSSTKPDSLKDASNGKGTGDRSFTTPLRSPTVTSCRCNYFEDSRDLITSALSNSSWRIRGLNRGRFLPPIS